MNILFCSTRVQGYLRILLMGHLTTALRRLVLFLALELEPIRARER